MITNNFFSEFLFYEEYFCYFESQKEDIAIKPQSFAKIETLPYKLCNLLFSLWSNSRIVDQGLIFIEAMRNIYGSCPRCSFLLAWLMCGRALGGSRGVNMRILVFAKCMEICNCLKD
jgi:hypothetical protein